MDIMLVRARAANAVMVKLIEAEDLMEIMGDFHPETNIDINHVTFAGQSVALPDNLSLGPQHVLAR